MTVNTEGLVVQQIRYGDNSLVVKIYTRTEGMQSFMIKGGKKPGGKFRSSCFFPLSQLEIAYDRPRTSGSMAYLREARIIHAYREMYTDIRKSSVAFFLAEVLGRCITQSEQDAVFYEKTVEALRDFDLRTQHIAEFHLFFLLEMASSLGFYPGAGTSSGAYFDLRDGCFSMVQPGHSDFLQGQDALNMARLLAEHNRHGGGFPSVTLFSSSDRFSLLQALARYCRLQAGVESTFHASTVLREVFEAL